MDDIWNENSLDGNTEVSKKETLEDFIVILEKKFEDGYFPTHEHLDEELDKMKIFLENCLKNCWL